MALVTAIAIPAEAATKADVQKVVRIATAKEKKSGMLSRKPYGDGGVQIVFVSGGQRYTVVVDNGKEQDVSFWARKEGTRGQEHIRTFTDYGQDGKVEYGIRGGKDTKLFDIARRRITANADYWQGEYDAAIAAFLRRFGKK